MVPSANHAYFGGCASVAGTLIGLLFVAISASPHKDTGRRAPLSFQVQAGAAFTTLIDALVVALTALLPGTAVAGSRLVRGDQALAVGEADEEPEPGEVAAQGVGAVGRTAGEPGQGRGEAVAVGFQPVAEEPEQLDELDGIALSTGIEGITYPLPGRQSRGRAGARPGNGTTLPRPAWASRSCWFSRVSWLTARTSAGTSARSWASSLFLLAIVCLSWAMVARSRASSSLSAPRSRMRW